MLVPIIIVLLITLFLNRVRPALSEGWQNYKSTQFNWISTGSEPLEYYHYPQYRAPYMYPFTFFKSYPQPHYSNYEPASGF